MADAMQQLWLPFMNPLNDMGGGARSNIEMVEGLQRTATLKSPECVAAFLAVDRRHFWLTEGGQQAYADMPLRDKRLHISAPHIYAKALESLLPLRRGMSFLNVGSGTGYFNSIVSEIIGPAATNHGLDVWPETVQHAKDRCALIDKASIDFTLGNVYQLDVRQTTRYDRIYLGACANSRSKYLYRLLEVGGVLVGPFQVGSHQQLRRVVRQTETQFHVEVLGSVQFATLIEPLARRSEAAPVTASRALVSESVSPPSHMTRATEMPAASGQIGLPGVRFTFSLSELPWARERSWLFPSSFKNAVKMGLMSRPRDECRACLPPHIWIEHIFPWCPKWWFEDLNRSTPPTAHKTLPPTPLLLPALALPTCCQNYNLEDVEHLTDDDASTRAPSSAASSAQSTPECGPSQSPTDISEDAQASLPAGEDSLMEIFGNGDRHVIGAQDDPDDIESDEETVFAGPFWVLRHFLHRGRQGVRRPRDEVDVRSDDEDAAAAAALRSDSDTERMSNNSEAVDIVRPRRRRRLYEDQPMHEIVAFVNEEALHDAPRTPIFDDDDEPAL